MEILFRGKMLKMSIEVADAATTMRTHTHMNSIAITREPQSLSSSSSSKNHVNKYLLHEELSEGEKAKAKGVRSATKV